MRTLEGIPRQSGLRVKKGCLLNVGAQTRWWRYETQRKGQHCLQAISATTQVCVAFVAKHLELICSPKESESPLSPQQSLGQYRLCDT